MIRDFTLRSVVLQHPAHREPGRYDVVFRRGRLSGLRPAPEDSAPRLFLTPGFHDAHVHLMHLGLAARRLDLSASVSLADALDGLDGFNREKSPSVVWAVGWDETRWPERRIPSREELDARVSDRPVIFRRVCGHLAVLNSAALEEVRRRRLDVDHSGRLIESQVMELAAIWPEDPAEREAALADAQLRALRMGVTRVGDMGGYGVAEACFALHRAGKLALKVDLFFPERAIEDVIAMRASGAFDERVRLGGIKVFADGSVGARTAAFLEPYADRQTRGALLLADHHLHDVMNRCRRLGLGIAIHAIGDAALGQVVRQFERVVEETGPPPPYWGSIEHAELPAPEILDRIARIGVRLSVQPNFVARWGEPGGLYERALGRERWLRMNPFRAILDRNIPAAFGSDCMPFDPALGLRGATRHPVESARLSDEEALSVYLGGRCASAGYWQPGGGFREGRDGAVLYAEDPLRLCAGDLSAAPVAGVLLNGDWVVAPSESLLRSGVLHVDR